MLTMIWEGRLGVGAGFWGGLLRAQASTIMHSSTLHNEPMLADSPRPQSGKSHKPQTESATHIGWTWKLFISPASLNISSIGRLLTASYHWSRPLNRYAVEPHMLERSDWYSAHSMS